MSTMFYQATQRFSGACKPCTYPIVRELPDQRGDKVTVPCPQCGQPVRLARLYGSFTDHNCNAACQYALGPMCDCSCGGANHQGGYIPPTANGEVAAEALSYYRRTVAKREAGIATRSAERAAAKREQHEADIAAWREEHPEAWAWIAEHASDNDFAADLARSLLYYASLTPRQTEAAERAAKRDAERAAAPILAPVPAPSGEVTLTGEVVGARAEETYYSHRGETTWKMLVQAEAGWKLWVTVPESLQRAFWADRETTARDLRGWLVGRQVALTVTVQPSPKDPTFAYGRRPRKAALVA